MPTVQQLQKKKGDNDMMTVAQTWCFVFQIAICFVIMLMIARGDRSKGKHGDRREEVQNGGQYGCYYEKGE